MILIKDTFHVESAAVEHLNHSNEQFEIFNLSTYSLVLIASCHLYADVGAVKWPVV